MIDFTHHVQSESARFAAAVNEAGPEALIRTVPSCPDWSLADLIWHLAQVQHFWTAILGEGVAGPEEYDRPPRPADADLLTFLQGCSTDLVAALRQRSDDETCWSWSPTGGTVSWVRRRQAQEALIHRVDAELAVNDRTLLDNELSGDGVDEILRVMLDVGELPPWASFTTENHRVILDTGDRWWAVRLGRFVGTDPNGDDPTGPGLDLPALQVEDAGTGSGEDIISEGDTRVAASASDLNLWLWGRAQGDALTVFGDAEAVTRLRATAADATS